MKQASRQSQGRQHASGGKDETPSKGSDFPAPPSPWVVRFAPHIPKDAAVLDLACGSGRHSRFLLDLGYKVLAVDRDTSRLGALAGHPRLEVLQCDLETGEIPEFLSRSFGAVVVINYLHRPLLPTLRAAISPGGLLIYETFAHGNGRLGKPSNPDFLLRHGELLEGLDEDLRVLAYEDLVVGEPRPAAIQRICVQRAIQR